MQNIWSRPWGPRYTYVNSSSPRGSSSARSAYLVSCSPSRGLKPAMPPRKSSAAAAHPAAPAQEIAEKDAKIMEVDEAPRKRAAADASKRAKKARVEAKVVDITGKHPSQRSTPGVVMTFGMGDMSQLGYESEGRKKPKIVPELEDTDIVAVECGGMHTAVVTKDGKVYTFGVNDEGALGRDGDELTPALVGGALEGQHVVQVSCGDSHTVALTKEGVLYHWGIYRDAQGKYGLMPGHPKEVFKHPVLVPGLAGKVVVRVVSGGDHAMALTDDGELYTWGCDEQGRLGRDQRQTRDHFNKTLTPGRVMVGKSREQSKQSIVDIGAGSFHSAAIVASKKDLKDTKLFVWGANGKGQLGLDNPDEKNCDRFAPEEAKFLSSHGIKPSAVAAGNAHTIILTETHKVYSTGKGTDGVLGNGKEEHSLNDEGENKWIHVETLDEKKVMNVSCGAEVTYARTADGHVYAWGFGENMQLGNGLGVDDETPSLLTPALLEGQALEDRKVLQISAGGQHTCLLASN